MLALFLSSKYVKEEYQRSQIYLGYLSCKGMVMADSKSQLRQSFLKMRESFTSSDIELRSGKLLLNLVELIYEFNPTQIFLYRSHKNEPVLDRLAEILGSEYSFALPRIKSFKSGKMVFLKWEKSDLLMRNKFGLEEPVGQADELEPNSRTLVCVPAVALDRRGGRMGYGGGFYDRFFSDHPDTLMVGIAFEDFLVNKLPMEVWDVSMNYVCTDASVTPCL